MHKRFDHQEIEKRWQGRWEQDKLYQVGDRDDSKEKDYILIEWPYPSGNLHIGHWYAFAVPDIYVRYKRMIGKQVLFPIGFDAFGLPAENAAIKRNINPREWTESNIEYMKGQLKSMGNAFSWDKTTSSTDPEYYKWTQWMFTQFFENDIAYRGEGIVNWCPGCNTVIANEQVAADNTCERCGSTIEKRTMPQWMLRITDFADALIDDLNTVDWPEHIKESQRNWIGRSSGALIDFTINFKLNPNANEWRDEAGKTAHVSVFTTRPDTLFGATYVVLAPEHPWLTGALQNEGVLENTDEVRSYIQAATQKNEQDRLDVTKEKTGVELAGAKAINPATNDEIPIFVADYVLGNYGTGAIMAVPAHDERDYEFAQKYDLPITQVVTPTETDLVETIDTIALPYTDAGILINSDQFNGLSAKEAKTAITEKVGGKLTNTYRLRDWSIGRQRYWGVPIPIVYDTEGVAHSIPKEYLPWTLPEDVDFTPTGEPPLAKSEELKARTERIFGAGWTPEVETMDTFVDSSWYYLRYLDNQNDTEFSSQTAQKDWLPVDLYFGGAEHTTMHLLYSRFWQKALHKLGLVVHREPYQKRVNRGLILGPDGNKMSKSKGNVIDPDEQVALVGSDTVKMYLAFMGPYQGTNYPWDMGGIAGIHRFLERVNGLAEHISTNAPEEAKRVLHKAIKKVNEDIVEYKFNTAISTLMVYVNQAEKIGLSEEDYATFIRLIAPFAPHLSEELWQRAGKIGSVHSTDFPVFDPDLARDKLVRIGVQINGKVRGDIEIAPDATEAEAWAAVEKNEQLLSRIQEQEITKKIYVPGRIMNIIVVPKAK